MTNIKSYFSAQPTRKKLFVLFIAAFIVRSSVFFFYIQHKERYKQADSTDYHNCAYLMRYFHGLQRPDNKEIIFWRTPGYPAFLLPFYYLHENQDPDFSLFTPAQKAALWAQIILCSFVPLIIFFLALLLSASYAIAWLTAWISVIHIGFVLSATYLLTDGLASLFFYLFLLLYYRSWRVWGESKPIKKAGLILSGAALSLGAYTWMRPMGIFVAVFSALLLIISNDKVTIKLKKMMLFLIVFFASVSPWYIRNYHYTGKVFFCPMSGGILQAFCAPKIIRRIHDVPLEQATRALYAQVIQQAESEEGILKAMGSDVQVSKHLICVDFALPWLLKHPFYAFYDWMVQVFKTLFDLYSSQLVAFVTNSHTFDPIEEFLTVKISSCLYATPIPVWMRIISWTEFFFLLLLWVGLCGGLWLFVFREFYLAYCSKKKVSPATYTWIKTMPMIGAVTFMTGGFGYARLRLPVEPLMIILALMFWFYVLGKKQKNGEKLV